MAKKDKAGTIGSQGLVLTNALSVTKTGGDELAKVKSFKNNSTNNDLIKWILGAAGSVFLALIAALAYYFHDKAELLEKVNQNKIESIEASTLIQRRIDQIETKLIIEEKVKEQAQPKKQ
jgi:hypothetical protein